MFPPAVQLFHQKKYTESTVLHALLHLITNAALVVLYLGEIPVLSEAYLWSWW
jgi:hypothetical protein